MHDIITKIYFIIISVRLNIMFLLREKKKSCDNNRQNNLVKILCDASRPIAPYVVFFFLHFQPKRHKNDVI